MDKEFEYLHFMHSRALSIFLTDPKRELLDGEAFDFDFIGSDESEKEIYYGPLLVLSNCMNMYVSFCDAVFDGLRKIYDDYIQGVIVNTNSQILDWNRTFASLLEGGESGISVMEKPYAEQMEVVAKVLVEYSVHCCIIRRMALDTGILPDTSWKRQMLVRLGVIIEELDKFMNKGWVNKMLDIQEVRRKYESVFCQFEKCFRPASNHLNRKACRVFDSLRRYRMSSNFVFTNLPPCFNAIRRMLKWRKDYISFQIGVGGGRQLLFSQTRKPPYVFEVWCFFELFQRLRERGRTHLAQYSLLRTDLDAPNFSLGDKRDVYYNFGGKGQHIRQPNRTFARTHIEWFIDSPGKWEDGIVIDTKFKRFHSDDLYRIWGYMNDFEVNNGIVFFRDCLDKSAFLSEKVTERFVLEEKRGYLKSCAATLTPRKEQMQENRDVLDMVIEAFFD